MELDKRLNDCARNIYDGKLLAILSGGDVVAQELEYRSSCLTRLYNKERERLHALEMEEKGTSRDNQIHPLVCSELMAYIVETTRK